MQWTADGGFTNAEPWLPYGDLAVNVAAQARDPDSMLSLYRNLIWSRRGSDALRFGAYAAVDGVPAGVFAYTRTHGDERLLVALNFTGGDVAFDLPAGIEPKEVVVGTHGPAEVTERMVLRGHEGRLLRL